MRKIRPNKEMEIVRFMRWVEESPICDRSNYEELVTSRNVNGFIKSSQARRAASELFTKPSIIKPVFIRFFCDE